MLYHGASRANERKWIFGDIVNWAGFAARLTGYKVNTVVFVPLRRAGHDETLECAQVDDSKKRDGFRHRCSNGVFYGKESGVPRLTRINLIIVRCLVQRERSDMYCASYCFGLFDLNEKGN